MAQFDLRSGACQTQLQGYEEEKQLGLVNLEMLLLGSFVLVVLEFQFLDLCRGLSTQDPLA